MGNLQFGCALPFCKDDFQCRCVPLTRGKERTVSCNAVLPALCCDCSLGISKPKSDGPVWGAAGTAGSSPVDSASQQIMVGQRSDFAQTDISLDTKSDFHPPMNKSSGGTPRHLCDYCHPKADAIGVELPALVVMATGRRYHATDCPQVKSIKEKQLPGFEKMRQLSDCAHCRHLVLHRMHYPGRSISG